VSTRNETVDDGKDRKYYRTAPGPTTEVRLFGQMGSIPGHKEDACTFYQCQHRNCNSYNDLSAIFVSFVAAFRQITKRRGLPSDKKHYIFDFARYCI
jgi:hypothetical protein